MAILCSKTFSSNWRFMKMQKIRNFEALCCVGEVLLKAKDMTLCEVRVECASGKILTKYQLVPKAAPWYDFCHIKNFKFPPSPINRMQFRGVKSALIEAEDPAAPLPLAVN